MKTACELFKIPHSLLKEVQLHFRGAKTAKVVGRLAMTAPKDGDTISGVLVRRNFNYHIMHPADLACALTHYLMMNQMSTAVYTSLAQSSVTQRMSVFYSGTFELLVHYLQEVAGDVRVIDDIKPITSISDGAADTEQSRVFYLSGFRQTDFLATFQCVSVFGDVIRVTLEKPCVYLDWAANPVNDMLADAAMSAVLQAEANPIPANRALTCHYYTQTPQLQSYHRRL